MCVYECVCMRTYAVTCAPFRSSDKAGGTLLPMIPLIRLGLMSVSVCGINLPPTPLAALEENLATAEKKLVLQRRAW